MKRLLHGNNSTGNSHDPQLAPHHMTSSQASVPIHMITNETQFFVLSRLSLNNLESSATLWSFSIVPVSY